MMVNIALVAVTIGFLFGFTTVISDLVQLLRQRDLTPEKRRRLIHNAVIGGLTCVFAVLVFLQL